MTDQDDPNPKVVRLFPDAGTGATPSMIAPHADEQAERLQQIEGILDEIEPLPASDAEPARGPPPGHRHAVRCPQCDCDTWRLTRLCVHCGGDLEAYAEQQAQRRRRRLGLIYRIGMVASCLITIGCLYGYNHYYRVLPPRVRAVLALTALGLIVVNVVLLGIESLVRGRR